MNVQKTLGLVGLAVFGFACGGSDAEEPKTTVSSGSETSLTASQSNAPTAQQSTESAQAQAQQQVLNEAQAQQAAQMAQDQAAQQPAQPQSRDIIDTALAAPQFSTLVKAIQEAGLVETLKGPGPYTVFAPTDEAFAKLPAGKLESLLAPENKEKLIALLNYHIIPNELSSEQVASAKSAKTVNGKTLRIRSKNDQLQINNAKVTSSEIKTSNGVIYVIDSVLQPK